MSRVLVADCIFFASEVSGIPRHDMFGHPRLKAVVHARRLAIWLARRHTKASWCMIQRRLHLNDHTTVMHHFRRAWARIERDANYAAAMHKAEARFLAWHATIAATRTLAQSSGVTLPAPKSSSHAIEALQ